MWNDVSLIKTLKEGGVVVMPTDTVYGVVGGAFSMPVVNRIYSLRKRSPDKPCIILIGSYAELEKFSIVLTEEQKNILKQYWPGAVSVIFDCKNDELAYLHRGTETLAFRLPDMQPLQDLLLQTGPLIAPSANPQGLPIATTIHEARNYFGDTVDAYIDGGEITGQPSKLIQLYKDATVSIIRE